MNKKSIFSTLVLSLALLIFQPSAHALDVGVSAPDFSLPDSDNKIVSLESLKGKVVVLEWFNKGCPFVQKHYKNGDMQQLQKLYKAKGVAWVLINSTNPSHRDFLNPEQTKALLKEWNITDAVVLTDSTGEVGKLYQAKSTPHMYVIDTEGKLRYQGAIDNDVDYSGDPKTATNYVDHVLKNLLGESDSEFIEKTDPYGCSIKY